MTSTKFDIDEIRIASPCPVGWEAMKGDNRKRFCDLCSLNVYNISEMTRTEAEALIRNSEGRVCARMYRRADGTVITKDCPVGLRAYRKRVAAFAGAALSMVLGLFSVGYGQCKVKTDGKVISAKKLDIDKKPGQKGESSLSGTIVDPNGAVVPNIEVVLFGEKPDQPIKIISGSEGSYSFASLKPGPYTLAIKAAPGFKSMAIKDIEIEPGFSNVMNIMLKPGETTTILVGVVGETPLIDLSSAGKTTVITREMIDRMPLK